MFETSYSATSRSRLSRRTLLSVGLAFFAAPGLAAPATRSPPQAVGLQAECRNSGQSGSLECDFPTLPPSQSLEIQYASAFCTINPAAFASVWAFQIFVTPPNAVADVPYQIPVPSTLDASSSFSGSPTAVWSAGAATHLFAKGGTTPRAFLYMGHTSTTPGLLCTVSVSGRTF